MSALIQSYREISLTITGTITTNALEAALAKITEIEKSYNLNSAGTPDVTGVDFILTGKSPYKVYSITFTTVLADAEYTIIFNGEAPNVDYF